MQALHKLLLLHLLTCLGPNGAARCILSTFGQRQAYRAQNRNDLTERLQTVIGCVAGIMHALNKLLFFHLLTCLQQNACGDKIIHGEKVPANTMQYMVSLQTSKGHNCGGFLISEDFVLTAAHCDSPNRPLTHVILGTHDLHKVNDENKRHIEKKHKHPEYKNVGLGYDIMLLKLSRKAELNDRVTTIPLPRSEIDIQENQVCRVAGWGKTEYVTQPHDLRAVDVSVISQTVCREQWRVLPPNVICAGGYNTNKGFCQGDSGGPLVCDGMAVGIVSFNKFAKCDYPHVPNVYTEISMYLPWIKNITSQ